MSIPRAALSIALVAAGTLVYEVLLTRVSALRLAFHFSFLVVSNALFAVGVAGALLTLVRRRTAGREQEWALRAAALFTIALPLTYAFLLTWDVPAQFRLADSASTGSLAIFNAVAALPFVFGGAAIGLLLQGGARAVHRVYAADLVGAAIGCFATPFALWRTGAGGTLCIAAALGALGAMTLARSPRGRGLAGLAAALLAAASPFVDARYPVPSKTELQLTPQTRFIAGDERVASRWSALSRIDVDRVPEAERSLFLRPPGVPMPRPEQQAFLMQDGSAGTYIHDYTGTPEALEGLKLSLYSLASRVLEPRRVFIIGAGGGDDVWAAKANGAERVKAVELNRAVLDVHTELFPDWSRGILEDPRVELVHAEGRSALLREARALGDTDRYDLLQMSGIDTWTALQSGAYMLAENFLYTRDAIRDMFGILGPDGAVQITRFSGDIEAIRLLATIRSVHDEVGTGTFADCVAVVPAGSFGAILAKRSPFTADELARLDRFLRDSGAAVLAHPRRQLGGRVEEFVRAADPAALLATIPYDLRPVSDDRPYFFHFHRWNDLGKARESIDAPMVVTQGNPLFLLGQLAIGLAVALLLLLPTLVVAVRGSDHPRRGRQAVAAFGYFGGVGAGYIVLQVALLQKLVLLVGHPLHSVTVTLFTMLLATGAGAFLSRNRFAGNAPPGRMWAVPVGLAVYLMAFSVASPAITSWAVPLADVQRFAVAAALVAPVGLLLGIPFAHGIAAIEERSPSLVPWAWSANAATTVVGSILAVIVSINLGFDAVFGLGVALYSIAMSQAAGLRAED